MWRYTHETGHDTGFTRMRRDDILTIFLRNFQWRNTLVENVSYSNESYKMQNFLVCHSARNLISQDLEAQNLFTLLEFTYNPLLCTDQCLHVSLENLNSRCSRWRVFSYESKMKSLKMLLYSIKAHLCMVCPSIFLYARIKCGLLYSEWCIT